jgi:hypothetical protein
MSSENKKKMDCWEDWANRFNTMYIESPAAKVHIYQGSCHITLLDNAFQRGKSCPHYSINFDSHDDKLPFINEFLREFDFSLEAIVDFLEGIEFSVNRWGSFEKYDYVSDNGAVLEIYKGVEKGIRVFSPFHVNRVKPLKEAPKKWTVSHVCRALINGQYKNLKCKGVYTDDYAFDAAYDYQRGPIKNGVAFAQDILEDPSGWWASDHRGSISICCHHFDSNEFEFCLEGQ